MDIDKANKEFLEKKKNNNKNKNPNSLEITMKNIMDKAKSKPQSPKKVSDDEYYQIFDQMNIYKRYRKAKLSDFSFNDEILEKFFNVLKKAMEVGKGLIICGAYGMGKTHFSFAFAKEYMKAYADEYKMKSKIPYYLDFSDFQNYLHNYGDKAKFVDDCIKAPLLILDDFLSIELSVYEMSQLAHIVNKRYNMQKPIIITTNLSPKELKNKCGLRMWERLSSVNYIKEVTGESRRSRFDKITLD